MWLDSLACRPRLSAALVGPRLSASLVRAPCAAVGSAVRRQKSLSLCILSIILWCPFFLPPSLLACTRRAASRLPVLDIPNVLNNQLALTRSSRPAGGRSSFHSSAPGNTPTGLRLRRVSATLLMGSELRRHGSALLSYRVLWPLLAACSGSPVSPRAAVAGARRRTRIRFHYGSS